jgi:hypothetical protein
MTAAVCGAASETDTALKLQSLAHVPIMDLTGKLDLVRLAALFARAALVIANDSGPLHLAAASGAPSLCVLGGGTFGWCVAYDVPPAEGRSLPRAVWHKMDCYGCGWRCVFQPKGAECAPCLAQVGVNQILDEALRILIGPTSAEPFGVSASEAGR